MEEVIILRRKSSFIFAIGFIIIVFVLSSFSGIVNFITDYKWFTELGYTDTFLKKLVTQFKIGIPVFIVLFGLLMFYIKSLKKSYYKQGNITPPEKGEKRLNGVIALVSAFISFFISSMFASNLWFTILRFLNSTEFNIKDPIFSNDLSYYIFKLPLIREITSLLLLIAFILVVTTIVFYLIMLSIRRPSSETHGNVFDINDLGDRKNLHKLLNKKIFNSAIMKIGIIGLFVFLIFGVNYILRTYDLLYSARGVAYGASYTDVHITLWVYRIMAGLSVVSAIGVLIGAMRKNLKLALTGPIIMIAVSIIGNLGSAAVQNFIVEPDEITKEERYLEHNINYTQKSYNLNAVKEKEFPVDQKLTKEDLLKNEETVQNIRINDYRPIKQVYNQLQGIRLYYRFNDIDIDRYNINGKYTQVFLSARELDQEKLKTKTWINEHLKYTHGFGFALSPVNSVTSDGQPELLVRSIPPVTETDLKIERPEIYFGEVPNKYIIVNSDEEEFDYPQGDSNNTTIYKGNAGIELNFLDKLLFAIKQRSLKILISGNVNSDSRIIINRDIAKRVRKIAPFIQYDGDPYLVANQEDGKLYWIIDGYTLSDKYPYSQPYSKNTKVNYIRNSVKVVIDAYNGTTNYYVYDNEDPVINTYKKIFPDLFKDKKDMPEGLKDHVRYPQTLFNIQSEVYKEYHVNNTDVFYNSEDIWDIAEEKYMDTQQKVESNYVMFKLPEEDDEEFLLTVPYTPATKPNLTSLFVARNDGDNYGKLFLYKFPKGVTVDGTMMVESRIDQDTDISQQLTLWGQEGSTVLRGNLLVVPIENSLLYVEPIYLQADNENSLPEMKRVIVAFKDKVVMEKTLDEALSKIFGVIEQEKDDQGVVDDVDTDDTEDKSTKELIKKANDLFNKAKEAQKNGNWTDYGKYLKELENILNNLNNVKEQ
ncbi:MAG: UPF0182 family protein [Firmicutes bacterium]|nr:UPF0182 family protein [Bacillota bacterium]